MVYRHRLSISFETNTDLYNSSAVTENVDLINA